MKKTIHITHGAMTIALTGIILFADRITLGLFMPFLALPLIIYGAYYSVSEALVVGFSNVLLSIILSGMIPTVVTMIGYVFVGLAYIYCFHENKTKGQFYIYMSLAMSILYFIMIIFFGEYFGISINETIATIHQYMPFLTLRFVQVAALFTVFLTMLMEVFIVKVSADIVLMMLTKAGHRPMKNS
ncbi:MAG TPA: DUF2232 domain-containing protein [Erysipelothrix sp.]